MLVNQSLSSVCVSPPRRPGGEPVCVSGEVCAVSPLLLIAGKRFFSFRLRERDYTVPIMVMVSRQKLVNMCDR